MTRFMLVSRAKNMKTWAELLKGIVYAHVFMCKRISGAEAIFKTESAHEGAFCKCEDEYWMFLELHQILIQSDLTWISYINVGIQS